MEHLTCKLLIVGAGPGGYICAIRAGQLGIDTIVVDEAKAGGTCLNVGCIPSKALIHAADEFDKLRSFGSQSPLGISAQKPAIDLAQTIAWKDGIVDRLTTGVTGLIRKAKVRFISGSATFQDGKTILVETEAGTKSIRAENVVIATGSSPIELPFLPFGGKVVSSTEMLALKEVPDRLVVVGGGYIGLELGTAFAKLGSKVTVVEASTSILPQYDQALTKPVSAALKALGVDVLTKTKAMGQGKKGLMIETENDETQELEADKILVTVGRKPRTDSAAIPSLDLRMDGPFIHVDAQCKTSMRNVYAIGDVTGEPMLAHRAMAQGEMVAELIAGNNRAWDDKIIPAVCFTSPEIVTCGIDPSTAKEAGLDVITGQFPFTANGRAMTMESEAGFVRVVARASDHAIIGIQGVGSNISEMASAFSIAIEMGARLEDIGHIVQAHPTQSEGLQEAALAALGHALHI